MTRRTFQRSLIAASVSALFAISAPALAANNTSGSMKGQIVDSASNSALAGATVTITNKANGASTTVTVSQNGTFRVPSLAIGDYKITITKDGYQTQVIENAKVSIGNEVSIEVPMVSGDVERISVTGARVAMVDTATPEIALTISADEVARLPISQDVVSVALLAPGTTKGDSAFGNLASFGGASVAENTFIINGVNVTGFRKGTSIADIPFSAYQEFQVKTGGYSAQFGRSTGGVVNAVTKRGNNGWEFGVAARWEPDALREQRPSVVYPVGDSSGSIQPFDMFWDNSMDETDDFEAELSVSGDIIEDTLFVYGLIQPQKYKTRNAAASGSEYTVSENDDPLWLARIDWQISEDHSLMVWGFSDSEDYVDTTFDRETNEVSRVSVLSTGGTTWSAQYKGRFTDWLSMDALYGEVEFNGTRQAPEDETCPAIYDSRNGGLVAMGCWQNFTASAEEDKREQTNVNFNLDLFDDHAIRFGVDYENNTSLENSFYSGHVYYRYYKGSAGRILDNGYVLQEDTEFARTRVYENGGEFTSKSLAWYLEDTWNILPNLTARIGLRSESFENLNANGDAFIKIDNQLAPRLGLSWDPFDDGESKLFVNWGRYHIPVASNTNVRMAGAELYYEEFNVLGGVAADGTPTIGAALGDRNVFGNGEAADPAEILDTSIKPMYQDEFILGYEMNLDEDWTTGIKFTHRDLKSVIDDITIDKGIVANGWEYDPSHGGYYVLTNPNTDVTVYYDTDGDGTLEQVTIGADLMGYPDPERIYNSIELTLTRRWNEDWTMNASYTWAQSYGNAEGYVKSDNGQDDAGLTTDWDFPYLMDGANGYLPNDRRHTLKLYGAYKVTDDLSVGANMIAQSGRPKNAFGDHLPDSYPDPYEYGDTYYPFGEKCARGCMGREDWRFTVDLSATYNLSFIEAVQADIRLDVFNVFNSQNVIKTNEFLDIGGEYNPGYGLPEEFEQPRYVRLSANVKF